jgi:predicted transcriptional regulator
VIIVDNLKLFDAEFKFMKIVWDNEPVNSTELARICGEKLGWKKPTTYTVIRKLVERGVIQNEKATVTALVKREQVQKFETDALLEKAFDNSMPFFLTAFMKGRVLSEDEADTLHKIIEGCKDDADTD